MFQRSIFILLVLLSHKIGFDIYNYGLAEAEATLKNVVLCFFTLLMRTIRRHGHGVISTLALVYHVSLCSILMYLHIKQVMITNLMNCISILMFFANKNN